MEIRSCYRSDLPRPQPLEARLGQPILIEDGRSPHRLTLGDRVGGRLKIVNQLWQPVELKMGDQIRQEVEIVLD